MLTPTSPSHQEKIFEIQHGCLSLRAIETSTPEPRGPDMPIVIFLPAGLKYSTGPGRLFVEYARRLARHGYTCYRFDPPGIGLSDGELDEGPIHKLWNHIEKGGFVDGLAWFAGHLKKTRPEKKLIVCGLCGGAITAILFADRHPRLVDGVISINVEPFFSVETKGPTENETPAHVNSVMKSYASKIFSAAAWWRLLSLQSDVRGIIRISKQFLFQGRKNKKERLEDFDNLNHELASSFSGIQKKSIPHLMLFSEHSRCWHNFQETFFTHLMGRRNRAPSQELKVIPHANHELQFREWRDEAMAQIEEWLKRSF